MGHYITQKALLFGGDIPTATDYAVASTPTHDIGDLQLLKGIAVEDLDAFKAIVKAKLEALIDKMKTTADDIPVMLVGGGALISPEILVGASRVIKPKFAGVANAIGAGKYIYHLNHVRVSYFAMQQLPKFLVPSIWWWTQRKRTLALSYKKFPN